MRFWGETLRMAMITVSHTKSVITDWTRKEYRPKIIWETSPRKVKGGREFRANVHGQSTLVLAHCWASTGSSSPVLAHCWASTGSSSLVLAHCWASTGSSSSTSGWELTILPAGQAEPMINGDHRSRNSNGQPADSPQDTRHENLAQCCFSVGPAPHIVGQR